MKIAGQPSTKGNPMKCLRFVAPVLFALALSASAQVRLNPGHTLTYEFTSLDYQRSFRASYLDVPTATVWFESESVPTRGVHMLVEMFEDSVSETPICSQIFSAPWYHDPGVYEFRGCKVENAWQDFQGVVRLTMLSGSLVFRDFSIEVLTLDPPEAEDRDVNQYLLVVPLQPRR
jgi:hypothetical protein